MQALCSPLDAFKFQTQCSANNLKWHNDVYTGCALCPTKERARIICINRMKSRCSPLYPSVIFNNLKIKTTQCYFVITRALCKSSAHKTNVQVFRLFKTVFTFLHIVIDILKQYYKDIQLLLRNHKILTIKIEWLSGRSFVLPWDTLIVLFA